MASTNNPTNMECAAAATAGAGAPARARDVLYCDVCSEECGTVLDAGFDPRLHGMSVAHGACKQRAEAWRAEIAAEIEEVSAARAARGAASEEGGRH